MFSFSNLRRAFLLAGLLLASGAGRAAEVMPPMPPDYCNDSAGVIPRAMVEELSRKLESFERTTSCQIVVAVFPKMQSDSSLEDYTHRMFQSWKIGQRNKNNGVGFFVFVQDHKMRIEVGYGLEGALPDALAKRIIEDEIKPRFKANDYAGGVTAGVDAIIRAARGEYKGTGRTVADLSGSNILDFIFAHFQLSVFVALILLSIIRSMFRPHGTVYHSGGSSYRSGFSFGSSSGWSSSDSSWSSGGGGFSGGGGSSGGGGASGSW